MLTVKIRSMKDGSPSTEEIFKGLDAVYFQGAGVAWVSDDSEANIVVAIRAGYVAERAGGYALEIVPAVKC